MHGSRAAARVTDSILPPVRADRRAHDPRLGPNPLLRDLWNQGQNGCRKLKPYTGRLRIAREFQGAGTIPGLHPPRLQADPDPPEPSEAGPFGPRPHRSPLEPRLQAESSRPDRWSPASRRNPPGRTVRTGVRRDRIRPDRPRVPHPDRSECRPTGWTAGRTDRACRAGQRANPSPRPKEVIRRRRFSAADRFPSFYGHRVSRTSRILKWDSDSRILQSEKLMPPPMSEPGRGHSKAGRRSASRKRRVWALFFNCRAE